MSRYAFHDSNWPSFEDITRRLKSDETINFDDREALIGDIYWLVNEATQCPRFENFQPAHMPFARPVIAGILREVEVGHAEAVIRKISAGLDAILARYRLTGKLALAAIDPHWAALHASSTGYQWRDLRRPLILLSTCAIRPDQVTGAFGDELLDAMTGDPTLRHPQEECVKGFRAWNRARDQIPGFPDVKLPLPRIRAEPKYLPWSAYRDGLRDHVRETLEQKPGFVTWDPNVNEAFASDPAGLAHGVELIRIGIGALVLSGTDPTKIVCIRDFAAPVPFGLIARQLFEDAGFKATRLFRTKLARLHAIAIRSCELTDRELDEIGEMYRSYLKDHKAYCDANPAQADQLFHGLDEAEILRKLRALPMEVFVDPPPLQITRKLAAKMKQPALLVLRIDAGLSDVTIRRLVFQKHFTEMDGPQTGCLKLHVPGSETANGVDREAIIPPGHSRILRCFMHHYRDRLDTSKCSQYMFPGAGENPLSAISISKQQVTFLREHMQIDIMPSNIRRLLRRFILNEDPKATGVVAAMLGLCDRDYVKGLARPHQEDAHARDFGKLVTSGALRADQRQPASTSGDETE